MAQPTSLFAGLLVGCVGTVAVAAPAFQQDFTGATTLGDVTGSAANQFVTVDTANSNFALVGESLDFSAKGRYPADPLLPIINQSMVATEADGNITENIDNGFIFTATFSYQSATVIGTVAEIEFGDGTDKATDIGVRSRNNSRVQFNSGGNTWEFSGDVDITFVLNNTGQNYNYTAPDADGTARSLASGFSDFWIDGQPIAAGEIDVPLDDPTVAINQFAITIPGWSGAESTIRVDNIEINALVIPTPASGLLAGLGSLLVFARSRRD